MKCPKCGYLGFAQADRCRNCGYDFALVAPGAPADLSLRASDRSEVAVDDLVLIDAAAARLVDTDTDQRVASSHSDSTIADLPLFTPSPSFDHDTIVRSAPPRPPLAVRRATPTPESLRALAEPTKGPSSDGTDSELIMPLQATVSPAVRASGTTWGGGDPVMPRSEIATIEMRAMAAAIDLGLLAVVDLLVVYFTLQVSGLAAGEIGKLPWIPLVAFLAVQNGSYLVAFTAGGQTLGKMATGIRVVPAAAHVRLDLARALLRTAVWTILAMPVGLGLLTALFDDDRRGLHDHVAGTKVVRTSR